MYLSFVNSKNFCTSQTALKSGSKFPPDFTSTDRYLVHFFEFFGDMPWSFLREDTRSIESSIATPLLKGFRHQALLFLYLGQGRLSFQLKPGI